MLLVAELIICYQIYFRVSDPELAPFMRRICLRDKQNKITYYPEGSHKVLPEPGMTYVSFLHEGDGELTILGAKYELTSMNYFQKEDSILAMNSLMVQFK